MLAFESASKWLLFFHFLTAVIAGGCAGHLGWQLYAYVSGKRDDLSLASLHAMITSVSYTMCFVLGMLIYPVFRVKVRYEYFDRALPWATGLFEIKEHFASIGLAVILGLTWLMWRMPDKPEGTQRRVLPLVVGLTVIFLVLLGFQVWSGWFLTTLKGI